MENIHTLTHTQTYNTYIHTHIHCHFQFPFFYPFTFAPNKRVSRLIYLTLVAIASQLRFILLCTRSYILSRGAVVKHNTLVRPFLYLYSYSFMFVCVYLRVYLCVCVYVYKRVDVCNIW